MPLQRSYTTKPQNIPKSPSCITPKRAEARAPALCQERPAGRTTSISLCFAPFSEYRYAPIMTDDAQAPSDEQPPATPHRRRPRYSGRNPRRFEEKYKEHDPQRYSDTVAKVLASGKTPAGTHRPIMVAEILEVLAPKPGELAVDCTLGYGGHARELLARLQPGGRLLGLDADPIELPKTEARLRAAGFGPDNFMAVRSNFAGLPQALAAANLSGADCILADLGVSSMQLDDPMRGFSLKSDGPLDMRMNPQRSFPASVLLEKTSAKELARMLEENADEPRAAELAAALAGRTFPTTKALAAGVRAVFPNLGKDEADLTVRRVFQALRIEVNDEFSALDMLLRYLPACLNPGGRVAILTFHSGEDRRVKKSFEAGFREGAYAEIAREVIRPTPEERHNNPRSSPAKLRWAIKTKV
jgi:16S rRNA (cytosine1402-N4)-methyltransferase